MKRFITVTLSILLTSASALANCSKDRPGLIRSADEVAGNIETLDGALHDRKAPEKTIRLLHHFEEGVLDFVKALRAGATCRDAVTEFQHFHEDVQLMYKELSSMPSLFHESTVLNAWNRLLPSFVRLQNRLYY